MRKQILLACGIAASLLYVAIDLLAAIANPGYHSFFSQTLSELMARGSPTEHYVDPLMIVYDVLMIAFALGVWASARSRRLRATAVLLAVYATTGLLGPTVFDMDVRTAAGATRADVIHLIATGVMSAVLIATLFVASAVRGRAFRIYSFATIATMLIFGALTGVAANVPPGAPTPWIGIFERILIGSFMAWVIVLARALARTPVAHVERRGSVVPPGSLAAT